MVKKLDTIVLSHDIEEYGLKQGDIGAVVHVYRDEAAYEGKSRSGEEMGAVGIVFGW